MFSLFLWQDLRDYREAFLLYGKPEGPSWIAVRQNFQVQVSRAAIWMLLLPGHTVHLCGAAYSPLHDLVPET